VIYHITGVRMAVIKEMKNKNAAGISGACYNPSTWGLK
jgi:hypothetical protein